MWALALATNREAGSEDHRWNWEGVVQALHAINFTLSLKAADEFFF